MPFADFIPFACVNARSSDHWCGIRSETFYADTVTYVSAKLG